MITFSHIIDSWISLTLAIIFGVLGTISLKLSHGLQRLKPSLCLILFYSLSFSAMTFAMKYIDLSIVYAVWSGIGTALVYTISFIFFKEAISFRKFFFLSLIILGVIGIHLSDRLA
jgi:small multidrug resistance pump